MNDQRDVGRGSQETQIKQQRRYSEEDGGRQILGVDGESNEQRTNDKKTKRPGGIDRGDIRIVRRKRSSNFGLIKDSEEFGGIFKDDYEFIPNNAEGDKRTEMWLYGEGKSSSATEGDRKSSNNHCKRTHRGEGTSMEDSLVEGDQQNIDCQGGFTSETFDHSRKRPTFLLTETEERHSISSEPKFTSPQKGKDSLGWAHNQLDTKNIAERERPELSQAIDGSCDRGHCRKNATKHLSDININSSNSFQRGGLTLFSETIELQHDTIGGYQERQLSTEKYCSFSTPIT